MKFPYIVNHNGVYYPAGADVPVGAATKPEESEETKAPEEAKESEETKEPAKRAGSEKSK